MRGPGAQRKAKVGADFLVSFVWSGIPATDKRNSRVRRETKRSANTVMIREANSAVRLKILDPRLRGDDGGLQIARCEHAAQRYTPYPLITKLNASLANSSKLIGPSARNHVVLHDNAPVKNRRCTKGSPVKYPASLASCRTASQICSYVSRKSKMYACPSGDNERHSYTSTAMASPVPPMIDCNSQRISANTRSRTSLASARAAFIRAVL